MGNRAQYVLGGLALSLLWFRASVASGDALAVEHWRRVVTYALAALAGAAFGAAAVIKLPTAP